MIFIEFLSAIVPSESTAGTNSSVAPHAKTRAETATEFFFFLIDAVAAFPLLNPFIPNHIISVNADPAAAGQ